MIGEKGTKGNGEKAEKILQNEQVRKAIGVYHAHKRYRRIFTPLLLIWCLIYQRINPDHSCDAVVDKLRRGDFDAIDPQVGKGPVSQRILSESNAGFCKARKQMPIQFLEQTLEQSARYVQSLPVKGLDWLERRVYLLDGSTLLARPEAELVRHYGQHKTAKRVSYWVVMRIVCLFCLQNGVVARVKEGSWAVSEPALGAECLSFLSPGDLVIGDRGFGMFRILQAVRHYQGEALVRLSRPRAKKLFHDQLYPGYDLSVIWSPSQKDTLDSRMSAAPIAGRLIYVRLERKGFRSQDLYLFTTLLDRDHDTRQRLIHLYGLRWQVELDLRFVKRTLDLYWLAGKSVDILRKELIAGMLAYNLVRLFMILAAHQSGLHVLTLSFTRCLRRVRSFVFRQRPKMLSWSSTELLQFLTRLAKATLPLRPKPRVEPRWVRPRDNSFPEFWIPRAQARVKDLLHRLSLAVS